MEHRTLIATIWISLLIAILVAVWSVGGFIANKQNVKVRHEQKLACIEAKDCKIVKGEIYKAEL